MQSETELEVRGRKGLGKRGGGCDRGAGGDGKRVIMKKNMKFRRLRGLELR